MLANLDKDYTTKQLIASLRNLYPILNDYYSFAFNTDDDFEGMVTITSIIQKITNNTTSLLSNNTIILDDDDNTQLLDDTTIVEKTVATFFSSNRNDQAINNDKKSTDGNNNNNKESRVNAGPVINKVLPFTLEGRDFESSEDDSEDNVRLPTGCYILPSLTKQTTTKNLGLRSLVLRKDYRYDQLTIDRDGSSHQE